MTLTQRACWSDRAGHDSTTMPECMTEATDGVPGTPTPDATAFPDWFVNRWTRDVEKSKLLPAAEALAVGEIVQSLRRITGRCAHGVGVYMAFWGFGHVHHRNTMLRGLRYALRPRVIVATQKKTDTDAPRSQYFEGFLCYQPNVLTIEELEALFERFHMSIGVADLDTMMSDAMVTCISRVSIGEYEFGNWHSMQNIYYRTEFARRFAQTQDRDARQLLQHTTGMVLSTSNMLALFHDRQNIRIDVQGIHGLVSTMRRVADDQNDSVSTALNVATDVPGQQGEQLRSLLMQSLDQNLLITNHVHSMLNVIDRMTLDALPPPPVVLSIMRRGPIQPAALRSAAATAAEFVPAVAAEFVLPGGPGAQTASDGYRRPTPDEIAVIRSFLSAPGGQTAALRAGLFPAAAVLPAAAVFPAAALRAGVFPAAALRAGVLPAAAIRPGPQPSTGAAVFRVDLT